MSIADCDRNGWCWWFLHHGRWPHTTYFPTVLGRFVCLTGFRECCRRIRHHQAHVRYVQASVFCSHLLWHTDKDAGPTDPPEYPWLYAIPGLLFGGGYIAAATTGMAGLVQAGYLTSSLLCMSSISGLSSQNTARQGNMLGMLGVSSGILASLGAVGFPADVLMQFGGVAAIGSMIGELRYMAERRVYADSV